MRRIQIEMHPNGSGHTETMKLNELWDSRMALVSHRLPHKELYCAGESMKCTRRKPNTWGGKGSCDTGGGGGVLQHHHGSNGDMMELGIQRGTHSNTWEIKNDSEKNLFTFSQQSHWTPRYKQRNGKEEAVCCYTNCVHVHSLIELACNSPLESRRNLVLVPVYILVLYFYTQGEI